MPLQRVVDRHSRANEPFAVIDQQPQIELGPAQVRRRQRVEAFAQRGPGDRERVDAVGLAATAGLAPRPGGQRVWTRSTRSPRSIRNRSKDAETCRQSSIAHTRGSPKPRAH